MLEPLPRRLLRRQPGAVRVPHPHPRRRRAARERHRDALRPRRPGSGDARVPGRHREPPGRGGAAQRRGAACARWWPTPRWCCSRSTSTACSRSPRGGASARSGSSPAQVVGLLGVRALRTAAAQILANIRRAMAGETFMDRRRGRRAELRDLVRAHARARRRARAGVIGVVERRQPAPAASRTSSARRRRWRRSAGSPAAWRTTSTTCSPRSSGHGELLLRRLEPDEPAAPPRRGDPEGGRRAARCSRASSWPSAASRCWRRVCSTSTWWSAEMEEMLRRLIGEHIELVIVLARPAGPRARRPRPARAGDHEPGGQRARRDGRGRRR